MSLHPTPQIHVSVLHRESLFALGCMAALRTQADLCVEACPPSGARPGGSGVVICDVDTGLALLDRAPAASPPRVLAMARHGRDPLVRLLLARGVHGCLLQDGPVDELAQAVRLVALGQRYLSVDVALQLLEAGGPEALTTRERQVLEGMARGLCNKGIARELDIALGTVKTHVKSVLAKLSASSRTQAVGIANERGLLGPRADTPARPPLRPATPWQQAVAA